MESKAKTLVLRESVDYILEAEIDGEMVDIYQREGQSRRIVYDLTVSELEQIVKAVREAA